VGFCFLLAWNTGIAFSVRRPSLSIIPCQEIPSLSPEAGVFGRVGFCGFFWEALCVVSKYQCLQSGLGGSAGRSRRVGTFPNLL